MGGAGRRSCCCMAEQRVRYDEKNVQSYAIDMIPSQAAFLSKINDQYNLKHVSKNLLIL